VSDDLMTERFDDLRDSLESFVLLVGDQNVQAMFGSDHLPS
jgi:hypothetical protein